MDKKILIFFALLIVFFSLMFLPDLRQNTDIFFLSFFLSNRVWFFIVLGVLLFLYGKGINNNNSLYYNNYLNIVIYIFFFSFFLLFINSYFNSDFFQFFYNSNFYFFDKIVLNLSYLNYIFFIIIIILGTIIYDYKIKNKSKILELKSEKGKLYIRYISLFLIFLLFISIRFGYPLLINGSYIDEYNHIFSGVDFFDSGNFSIFNTEGEYKRGAFLSIYIGIFFLLFGKSIFVAKISIAILSIISFILVYKISKIIYNNKLFYINLLLLIFTLNPLLIFEHFYIRPYIIYEISILYIVYAFLKIFEFIENKNNYRILFSILLINLLGFIIYYFSEKDVHRYIILLFSVSITFYFFVFKSNKLFFNSIYLEKFFSISKKLKILIILSLIPFLFFQFNIDHLLIAIFDNKQYHGSLNISKYYELFFSKYFLFTIFFVFFYIFLFLENNTNNKKYIFIYLMILMLFLAHLLSNTSSHLIRGIIYILPLFFIISVHGLYLFNELIPKKINYFIIFFLFLSIFFSYNLTFLKSPFIKGEINYMEYYKIAEFIKTNCNDKKIVALIHNPYILNFYGVNIDYTSNIYIEDKGQLEKYNYENDIYTTMYKNIPVITNMAYLKEKILINSCIVLNEESKHYWYYFDNNEIDFLKQNFKKVQFGTQTPVNIFYN